MKFDTFPMALEPRMKIVTDSTRRLLFAELSKHRLRYNGDVSEAEFLNALFDLKSFPTTDSRPKTYPTMLEDLEMHRVQFPTDWPDNWVFTDSRLNLRHGSDEKFLEFLSHMLHPVVRSNQDEVTELLNLFNKHLKPDGLEFVQTSMTDNRSVYEARPLGSRPLVMSVAQALIQLGSQAENQISRLKAIEDSSAAIGAAKELIETVCKTVLTQAGKRYEPDVEVPKLAKDTLNILRLGVDGLREARNPVQRILSSLTGVAQGIAELRNIAGTGHGREATARDLSPIHAKLAADAAITFVHFVVEVAKLTLDPPREEPKAAKWDQATWGP